MTPKKYLVFLFVCLLLPNISLAQEDLQEQTLLMTFIPNIQFAPVYAAIEAGYFSQAGYDVSIEYLEEPQVVDLIAANENQFGIVSGEQIILAASQERPVVYVYEWFQEFPVGIVYDGDLAVSSIEDLVDIPIGIPGRFGATYSGIVTLLESAGLAETDVTLDEIGFAAPEVFCVGAIQASVIYVNNEPLQIQNRVDTGDCGDVANIDVLHIADVVDLVSNGLITNQEMIDNQPDNVQSFVAAFDAGLSLTINNPARAYLLSAPHIEGLPLDPTFQMVLENLADDQDNFLAGNPSREEIADSRETLYQALATDFDDNTLLQFEVLLASIDLWDTEQLGYTEDESWNNMQNTLLSLGLLEESIPLDSIYTNNFLPQGE